MRWRKTWKVLGGALIVAGAALGGWTAWQLWGTTLVATHQQHKVVDRLEQGYSTHPVVGTTMPKIKLGDVYGLISIPSLKLKRPIIQGVGRQQLNHGVGHYPDSVQPGAEGNFALAGHRTTHGAPFGNIDDLRAGDKIVIQTVIGRFVYRVRTHRIVKPTDVWVVSKRSLPEPEARQLVMTSCNPRFSASQRYVVFADLVEPGRE